MPTSYSTLLGLALPVTGELSGTWGDEVNNYITQYLDSAVAGTQTISGSQTAVTLSRTTNAALSQAGSGATGSSQYQIINCTGNPGSALTVTVPSASKAYLVLNNTSTNQTVTVKGAATTGVTVSAGRAALIAWNGTDFELVATDDVSKMNGVVAAVNGGTGQSSYTTGDILYASSSTALAKLAGVATGNALISGGVGVAPSYGKIGLTTHVSGTLPIANGGTNTTTTPTAGAIAYGTGTAYAFNTAGSSGQPLLSGGSGAPTFGTLGVAAGGTGSTTQSGARTGLGATTVGSNFFTLTNPSAITFPRINADNTVSALSAADFRTAIGAGTGGGTVTSVSWTGGIVSVATATTTPAFTIAGTSGGIPYFSSASTWATSAALAANALVIGGGAGAAPATTTTGSGVLTALGNAANATNGFATVNGTATLTNKRIDPRVSSTSSTSSLTPDISSFDQYVVTALAETMAINAPTGTPVDGNKLIFRILDNGTSRTLNWNGTYTAIGATLPTSTTASKTTYVGCIYNANNTRWDVIAVTTQA